MKNYWILTRLMLKNLASSMNPFNGVYEDGQKKRKAIFRALGVGLLALYGLGFIVFLEIRIFGIIESVSAGLSAGMKAQGLVLQNPMYLVPALAILMAMMVTLILGLFQGLGELYQGKDAPFLAVLPLSSRQVFAARLTSLYVTELLVNLLLLGPAFVLYAVKSHTVMPVALTALPVFLLTPAIPLSVVALLSALLMRLSFFSRHREAITLALSMLIAIAYATGVTLVSNRSTGGEQAFEELVSGLVQPNGLAVSMLRIFPPALWALNGLTGSVPYLLLLMGVSAAALAVVILLVGPGYLDQALSTSEQTVVTRKSRGPVRMESHSVLRTMHSLEWKRLMRTPSWVYNGLAGVIMFPLMMGIGLYMGLKNSPEGLLGVRAALSLVDPLYIVVFGAAALCMGSMVNPVVSTAVSREGGNWPFALSLPVNQNDRFLAKILCGMEINAICSVLIGAVAYGIMQVPLTAVLGALILALLVDWAVAAASLWVDASHPRFKWMNEMEAIKKNFNQVTGMLIWLGFVSLCVIAGIFCWRFGTVGFYLGVLGTAFLEALLSTLLVFRAARKTTMLNE